MGEGEESEAENVSGEELDDGQNKEEKRGLGEREKERKTYHSWRESTRLGDDGSETERRVDQSVLYQEKHNVDG
jgi:hypothetical protein